MPRATNTRLLAHIDCDGGGQVWLDRKTLYVAHNFRLSEAQRSGSHVAGVTVSW
jgi:hypothetical protein